MFLELFSPQSIREAVKSIPELASNPEVGRLLKSEEFHNPILLRQTLLTGLDMLEIEVLRLLLLPQELADILNDIKPIFDALSSDMIVLLRGVVESLPLTKDASFAPSNILQSIIDDDELLETIRLSLVEFPEVLQYVKIPTDVIENSKLFRMYMRGIGFTVQDILSLGEYKKGPKSSSKRSLNSKRKRLSKRFPSIFGNGNGVM